MDRVLIVTPDSAERSALVQQFNAAQYDTASADDLVSGLARIAIAPPDLLVTVVRPDVNFNGLPLVMSGLAQKARMAALVVHESPDAASDHEKTIRTPGTLRHIVRPTDLQDWVRAAGETLALRERRRWSRTALAAPPSVVTAEGRVTLLNVSYGGVGLDFVPRSDRMLPALLRLELPTLGTLVNVERIWSSMMTPHLSMSCGAAIASESLKRTLRWRRLVDALRRAGTVLV
jgi:CheY-like chemotaxis protein